MSSYTDYWLCSYFRSFLSWFLLSLASEVMNEKDLVVNYFARMFSSISSLLSIKYLSNFSIALITTMKSISGFTGLFYSTLGTKILFVLVLMIVMIWDKLMIKFFS